MPKLFNNATNKRGLIVYGGEASSDFGMVIEEAPAFDRPKRKATTYTVPGRNGVVLFQQDAWEDTTRSYNVFITDNAKDNLTDAVNAIEAWLNSQVGYTRLEDSFEPDVYRLAYYNGGDAFSNSMTQYGRATLTFSCRPERFYKYGENAITVTNGDSIFNATRFASKPLIYIRGTGDVTITLGGSTITATVNGFINIDCDSMNAYRYPDENENASITGAFPTIPPGSSTVGITGTTTLVTITPRFYTI